MNLRGIFLNLSKYRHDKTKKPHMATTLAKNSPYSASFTAASLIRMNQRGVSYVKLFGPYLRNARKVELTDPFVRLPYQIDNLIEFINAVRQSVEDPERLEIHLTTANGDEHRPDVIDIFDAITDDLAPRGIDFTYDFEADHDRFIRLDNGWKINLGHGLDIFDKVERFSIDRISQEDRRCKACSIAFVRKEDER